MLLPLGYWTNPCPRVAKRDRLTYYLLLGPLFQQSVFGVRRSVFGVTHANRRPIIQCNENWLPEDNSQASKHDLPFRPSLARALATAPRGLQNLPPSEQIYLPRSKQKDASHASIAAEGNAKMPNEHPLTHG